MNAMTAPFLSPEELRYTFGVHTFSEVPQHEELYPQAEYSKNGQLKMLIVTIHNEIVNLTLEPSMQSLVSPHFTTIFRNVKGGGSLNIGRPPNNCHYQHKSSEIFAAVSNCDGSLKGVILTPDEIYILHPLPDRHIHRFNQDNRSDLGLHVIYKREIAQKEFCGLQSIISSTELTEDENAVSEDVYATGHRLTVQGELIVELAIFVDETLWKDFSSKYGSLANSKLQDYALTMLNNVQIMYHQPSAVPQLTFHVVRFEVLTSQPNVMAPHLHDNGHAQKYLDRFCRYQRNLNTRDWDHALLLTGYDIHRGTGSRSISGIARLDGMCDPWNTCTLAEGLDFTSAFIGTHELGHSVGMRHDEPYCPSNHIMSSSLGPGKVTWSTCSLRDYHAFLQRLDNGGKNCLRVSNLPQRLTVRADLKPGQVYNADTQCYMMHGQGYRQITPRQDHYDGICYMMWCGQSLFGRIITSHPALEGTFCGPSKWCELGRCVPWPGGGSAQIPKHVDGGWSQWSEISCQSCTCTDIIGSVGLVFSIRSCNNPSPSNGGAECIGSSQRAVVCNRYCTSSRKSVEKYISERCTEQKRLKNDADLTGNGSQLTRYPQRACKVFCDVASRYGSQRNYRFFGDILPDGSPCASNKYCLNGECLPLSCDDSALITRDVECSSIKNRCPQRSVILNTTSAYQWSTWSSWSLCSQTCGTGYKQRARSCNGGNQRCSGASSEQVLCNLPVCDTKTGSVAEGVWSDWTPWNQCSVTCGIGSQARYRRCTSLSQASLLFACSGSAMERRECNMGVCIEEKVGLWGSWTDWSQCSVTCGPGIQSRNRYCTKEPCDGSGQSRMSCNLGPCKVATQWSEWSGWTQCSKTCENGIRTRDRRCLSQNGCRGNDREQEECNKGLCPSSIPSTVGVWSGWSAWNACSSTCGGGYKWRTRYCQHGTCSGAYSDTLSCNTQSCELSSSVTTASWGGWGYWSPCSETCDRGVRKRVRKCYGSGGKCPGNEYDRQVCNVRRCSG